MTTLACASDFVMVAPVPPAHFDALGQVEGRACGSLLLFDSELMFIPVALNGRVERAYQEALSRAPGATSMIDVSYQENWFWWVIGLTRCATISGQAIRAEDR